ncbi:hypothetical protein Hanom_Chr10g00920591 [Helianthus anomalus]
MLIIISFGFFGKFLRLVKHAKMEECIHRVYVYVCVSVQSKVKVSRHKRWREEQTLTHLSSLLSLSRIYTYIVREEGDLIENVF